MTTRPRRASHATPPCPAYGRRENSIDVTTEAEYLAWMGVAV